MTSQQDDQWDAGDYCQMTPLHLIQHVPATTTVQINARGTVRSCQTCADIHAVTGIYGESMSL